MQELIRFQTDRDLDKKDYIDVNEHSNIVEELLESLGLDVPKENRPQLKAAFAEFVNLTVNTGIAKQAENIGTFSELDIVDAYCDIITFCTGAVLKLGYNPIIAIEECGKEINSRSGSMIDGKFEKDLSEGAKSMWYKADYTRAKND